MHDLVRPALVLDLPFHECEGGNFASRDAGALVAAVTGAAWHPNGRWFDGVDDRITVSDTRLNVGSGVTVEAWAWHDAPGNEFIAARWTAGYAYGLLESASRALIGFVAIGGVRKEVFGVSVLPVNAWLHLAVTYDGSSVRTWINARPEAALAAAGLIDAVADPLTIGWGISNAYAWAGRIGEVRVYGRGLAPAELERNYLATKWRYR